jgi:hypothetical protein
MKLQQMGNYNIKKPIVLTFGQCHKRQASTTPSARHKFVSSKNLPLIIHDSRQQYVGNAKFHHVENLVIRRTEK